MSAASEYYGVLLSQGYNEEQIARFAHLANQGNKGVISHNQAYRIAKQEGWSNGDGKFKDWLSRANDKGWIDKGLAVFGAVAASGVFNKEGEYIETTPPPPPPKRSNTMLYIIGGVVVVGIGAAIYFANKKK